MNLQAIEESEARFEAYVQELTSVIGHKDRAEPLRGYCKGLLVETGRKSVEPMAAAIAPERTAPRHQSLLHPRLHGDKLCWQRGMVRCGGFGQSPGIDFTGNGKAWFH